MGAAALLSIPLALLFTWTQVLPLDGIPALGTDYGKARLECVEGPDERLEVADEGAIALHELVVWSVAAIAVEQADEENISGSASKSARATGNFLVGGERTPGRDEG